MIELLKALVARPSPSGGEKEVADFLEAWLRGHGLSPFRAGNNLFCIKGSGPAVLLDAHIDTVKPADGWTRDPYAPSLEGGRLYGLGVSDDGGSLVALTHAFLAARPQHHTLVLSLSAQEENSGADGFSAALPAMEEKVGPFVCGIVGEPTGLRMAVSEKGLMVLDCTVKGVAGHAARGNGVNAIYEAFPMIEWFRENGMQVTQISAGTQHNVIPDVCRFLRGESPLCPPERFYHRPGTSAGKSRRNAGPGDLRLSHPVQSGAVPVSHRETGARRSFAFAQGRRIHSHRRSGKRCADLSETAGSL